MNARVAVLTVVVASLACGGGGPPARNVEACEAYVEHVNALPCYPGEMDPAQMCPRALDDSPCDLTGYYECLVEHATCEGDRPVLETSACTPPC